MQNYNDKIQKKINKALSEMTLLEKCGLLGGKRSFSTRGYKKYEIPEMILSDGPHGLRHQDEGGNHLGIGQSAPATCFPTASILACSWDQYLLEKVGVALGEEAAVQKIGTILGPGLNIKRSPLCGRNFEYFSEDPILAGRMAAGMIRGIESQNASACPKHFAVNSQETRRQASNSILDEKTLREIYLTGFEIAVKEGQPGAIMSSYNMVNGEYANENKHLLVDILRDEWGFNGAVITDWGGSNSHTKGTMAGSSLEMPPAGGDSIRELVHGVNSGKISEEEIDKRVSEVLRLIFSTEEKTEIDPDWKASHEKIAEEAAEESFVLLKNQGEKPLLPINNSEKIAIIGGMAFDMRYQGSGSSKVNPIMLDNIEDVAIERNFNIVGSAQGYRMDGKEDIDMVREANSLAESADTIIYFCGLSEIKESEGLDRADMKISENQLELLRSLNKINKKIVVVLVGGASIETGWINLCRSILYVGLSGQAGAHAIWNVLTGIKNPCGKLAETWGKKASDYPVNEKFPSYGRDSVYSEGPFVGYRYFSTNNISVDFPFGYGLSYSKYEYSNLNIDIEKNEISFLIKNTGDFDGAEIAQMYIGKPDRKNEPLRELKGFTKVYLRAGEEKLVTIPLDEYTFRFFDIESNKWEIETGTYSIFIGASVMDIRLSGTAEIKGTVSVDNSSLKREEFYDNVHTGKSHPIDRNMTFGELKYSRSPILMLICLIIDILKKRSDKSGHPNINVLFIYNMPLRALAKMSDGFFSMRAVDGLVLEAKGFWLIGIIYTIIALICNGIENIGTFRRLSR